LRREMCRLDFQRGCSGRNFERENFENEKVTTSDNWVCHMFSGDSLGAGMR
jgi:hypothetical protein